MSLLPPIIRGFRSGYYLCQKDGCRSAVVNSRKGERFAVNDSIEVEILDIDSQSVRLGVVAPDGVVIRCAGVDRQM